MLQSGTEHARGIVVIEERHCSIGELGLLFCRGMSTEERVTVLLASRAEETGLLSRRPFARVQVRLGC
jgi:hypothetical protein